jgi:hypothetical protein
LVTPTLFKRGKKQKKIIGTLNYMVPEFLIEKYNQKCDYGHVG